MNARIDQLLRQSAWVGFLGVALAVYVCVPARLLGERSLIQIPIGVAFFLLTVGLAHRMPGEWFGAARRLVMRWPSTAWALIGFGAVLRIAWVLVVPPVQTSDFDEYWGLARNLLNTGEYFAGIPEGATRWYAYRAPGYTFFLAGWMALLGEWRYLPALTNLLAYVVSSRLLLRIGEKSFGEPAGIAAVALYAVWPSHIATTGLAMYETLFMALCLGSVLCLLDADKGGVRSAAWAGVWNALASFVRPTALAMPAIWLIHAWRRAGLNRRTLVHAAVATLVMVAVIAPWTIRNYRRGIPVVISGNGNSSFVLVANPKSAVEYDEMGLNDVIRASGFNEVQFYSNASHVGRAWIRDNFWLWMRQNIERQVIFLGEDGIGFFWSLKEPFGYSGLGYVVLHALGHAWWCGLWALAVVGAVRGRTQLLESDGFRLLSISMVTFVATAFPFVVAARYHMPLVPVVLLMAGMPLVGKQARVIELPTHRGWKQVA